MHRGLSQRLYNKDLKKNYTTYVYNGLDTLSSINNSNNAWSEFVHYIYTHSFTHRTDHDLDHDLDHDDLDHDLDQPL